MKAEGFSAGTMNCPMCHYHNEGGERESNHPCFLFHTILAHILIFCMTLPVLVAPSVALAVALKYTTPLDLKTLKVSLNT